MMRNIRNWPSEPFTSFYFFLEMILGIFNDVISSHFQVIILFGKIDLVGFAPSSEVLFKNIYEHLLFFNNYKNPNTYIFKSLIEYKISWIIMVLSTLRAMYL